MLIQLSLSLSHSLMRRDKTAGEKKKKKKAEESDDLHEDH